MRKFLICLLTLMLGGIAMAQITDAPQVSEGKGSYSQ